MEAGASKESRNFFLHGFLFPSGFNGGGDIDIYGYFNMIVSINTHDLFYQIRRLLHIRFMKRYRNKEVVRSFAENIKSKSKQNIFYCNGMIIFTAEFLQIMIFKQDLSFRNRFRIIIHDR